MTTDLPKIKSIEIHFIATFAEHRSGELPSQLQSFELDLARTSVQWEGKVVAKIIGADTRSDTTTIRFMWFFTKYKASNCPILVEGLPSLEKRVLYNLQALIAPKQEKCPGLRELFGTSRISIKKKNQLVSCECCAMVHLFEPTFVEGNRNPFKLTINEKLLPIGAIKVFVQLGHLGTAREATEKELEIIVRDFDPFDCIVQPKPLANGPKIDVPEELQEEPLEGNSQAGSGSGPLLKKNLGNGKEPDNSTDDTEDIPCDVSDSNRQAEVPRAKLDSVSTASDSKSEDPNSTSNLGPIYARLRDFAQSFPRNRTSWLIASGVAIFTLCLLPFIWKLPHPTSPLANTNPIMQTTPDEIAKDDVQFLHFDNLSKVNGVLFLNGTIHQDDDLRIDATFASPRFCYLFALNTNNTVQLLYPPTEDQHQSTQISELHFPAESQKGFGLTDGVGQQGFVLVKSKETLPSFSEWKNRIFPEWNGAENTQQLTFGSDASGKWMWRGGRLEAWTSIRGNERLLTGPRTFSEICGRIQGSKNLEVYGVSFPVKSR